MINKVQIIGNLGSDPEVRYTNAGAAVATFSVATTEKWKDKDGNQQEETEWHRVVAWKRLGEICGEYLSKGSQVYIEGKLKTRSWDQDGVKRYSTEIIAREMKMLGQKGGSSGGGGGQQGPPDYGGGSGTGEDVPF